MLSSALSFISNQLDYHISSHFRLQESAVVVNSLVGLQGQALAENHNKLIVSLVNLEQEVNHREFYQQRKISDGQVRSTQPKFFNISLLFTANFDNYQEALKFLDATISFFQVHGTFDARNNPEMPTGTEKLNFEVADISLQDMIQLRGALGSSGQPAILYRLRQVCYDSDVVDDIQPVITDQVTEGHA